MNQGIKKVALKKFIKLNLLFNIGIYLLMQLLISKPSHAFIPTIFEPNTQELNEDSIEIGRSAPQLIYLNEAKEAIRYINLEGIFNHCRDTAQFQLW